MMAIIVVLLFVIAADCLTAMVVICFRAIQIAAMIMIIIRAVRRTIMVVRRIRAVWVITSHAAKERYVGSALIGLRG